VDKKVELKCEATFSSPLVEDNVDLYTIEWTLTTYIDNY
jgi:hypothetical protein